jgi:hypothetical protein
MNVFSVVGSRMPRRTVTVLSGNRVTDLLTVCNPFCEFLISLLRRLIHAAIPGANVW